MEGDTVFETVTWGLKSPCSTSELIAQKTGSDQRLTPRTRATIDARAAAISNRLKVVAVAKNMRGNIASIFGMSTKKTMPRRLMGGNTPLDIQKPSFYMGSTPRAVPKTPGSRRRLKRAPPLRRIKRKPTGTSPVRWASLFGGSPRIRTEGIRLKRTALYP